MGTWSEGSSNTDWINLSAKSWVILESLHLCPQETLSCLPTNSRVLRIINHNWVWHSLKTFIHHYHRDREKSSRPHIQAFIFIFLQGPCTETAEMSTRVHLDNKHWINLVDLYNAGRVCWLLGVVSMGLYLRSSSYLPFFSLSSQTCCGLWWQPWQLLPGIPRDVQTFPWPYPPQIICRGSLGQVAAVWMSLQFSHRSSTRGQEEKEKSCSSQGGLCPAHHRGFCKIPLYAKRREEKYT